MTSRRGSGNGVTGNNVTSNDVTGNGVTGNDITENDDTGNDVTENGVTGSGVRGVKSGVRGVSSAIAASVIFSLSLPSFHIIHILSLSSLPLIRVFFYVPSCLYLPSSLLTFLMHAPSVAFSLCLSLS